MAMTTAGRGSETMRSEFVTGLVNAHALEKQAIELMERQIERCRQYPETAARLREHLEETRAQEERLDQLLDSFGESRSAVKDMVMKFSANLGAMMHATSDDEILKNTFANAAFENYEAACYESLIAMAETGGFTKAIEPLQQSLSEERAMAEWVQANVGSITRRYMELKSVGAKADR